MSKISENNPHQAQLDLISRFYLALDTRDWDQLPTVLAEDAVLRTRMVRQGVRGPEVGHVEGRDAIIAMIQGLWERLAGTHHMTSNHIVEIGADGETASGNCTLRAHHAGIGAKAHLFEESLARIEAMLTK